MGTVSSSLFISSRSYWPFTCEQTDKFVRASQDIHIHTELQHPFLKF
jgi:hypothetical protein